MNSDLRAIVECLLTAHYSDVEIVEYLTGPLGLTEHEAVRAVRDAVGLSVAEPDDPSAV